MADKPSAIFLENIKKEFQKRLTESSKLVQGKVKGWEESERWYNNEALPRERQHESNLIIPKAYYTVETITPQIMQTYFGMAQWLTIKDPNIEDAILRRQEYWMMWFMMTKMKMYLRTLEAVKGAVSIGTSIEKMYMRNGIPANDYVKLKNFRPDPRCQKPGEVDSMAWCIEIIENKSFGELERAIKHTSEQVPLTDIATGEELQEYTTTVTQDSLYFNLKEVYESLKEMSYQAGENGQEIDIPVVHLAEMWGEIETERGVYDTDTNRYKEGKYEEYIVAATVNNPGTADTTINTIIRCEPSTFKYRDIYEDRDIYLKPYIAWLYNIKPGQFYGDGVIDPIKSSLSEQKEHRDLVLDNHKRSVLSILSVLQKSGLTDRELEMSPFAKWKVKRHDDVQVVQFPEINMQAVKLIDDMIDKEIDRTTSVSAGMQGIPVSKRQTGTEYRGLMAESARRHSMFIQTSHELSMKPKAFKTMLLMKQMPHIIRRRAFPTPDGEITINPDELLEQHDISFAATGVEPEHSVYQKADMFPKLIDKISQAITQSAQSLQSGAPVTLNVTEVIREMETIYNFKNPERFVLPNQGVVPVAVLLEVAGRIGGPQLQGVVREAVNNVHQILTAQQQGGPPRQQGGPPAR